MTDFVPPTADGNQPVGHPDPLDPGLARVSSVYDYLVGGGHNFDADRVCAEQLLTVLPQARLAARHNKQFLRRAVAYCLDRGIRQFLDLGSGLLTAGALHDRASAWHPDCRVVYVDNDPVAVSQSQLVLADRRDAAIVCADITTPDTVLANRSVGRMLDFTEPMAVIMGAVLDFVPDSVHPARLIDTYADAVAPGSYLVLSHATADDAGEQMIGAAEIYAQIGAPLYPRTRVQVTDMLSSVEHLVHPGVVYTSQWRSDVDVDAPTDSLGYGAVAYVD